MCVIVRVCTWLGVFGSDYVDRGKQSLETCLARGSVFACVFVAVVQKIQVVTLCCCPAGKRRYNVKLWKIFTDCFNTLPIAAVIDEKIFCMHGGLSPELGSLDQIKRLPRPTDIPDTGLLCDLLWSDPEKEIVGWGENDRGVSFTFGPDVVASFLKRHDLDLICRAHQVRYGEGGNSFALVLSE